MTSGSGSQPNTQFSSRGQRSTRRYSPYPSTPSTLSHSPHAAADLLPEGDALAAERPSGPSDEEAFSTDDESLYRQSNYDLKDLAPAYEAYYNAALSTSAIKRFRCTENTRVEVLENICIWASGDNGVKIYWLNGMAGTGKTTIAYTLCELLHSDGQLGASFFCSRSSPDCRDVNRIVPTIAYQLGLYSSSYRDVLCDTLEKDPDLARRNIGTQFERLIAKPLARIGKEIPKNIVVVIDALDECTDVGGTKDVLELLLQYADDLPLKFFVVSRPEPSICGSMESRTGSLRSILWLHDIEESLVEADIKTYLNQALKSYHVSSPDIDQLASLAGCLFIFAATAVRYIVLNHGGVDPHERLRNVLDSHTLNGDKRYKELDSLYRIILSKALNQEELENHELERRERVLWTVVCAREPLNPATLSELLDLGTERQIRLAIQSLQSVLNISDSFDAVSTLHASFPDFLLNCDRSKAFFCDSNDHNSFLATRCFDRMEKSLRFNICNLETSELLDEEVPGLDDRITAAISPGLFYACRYWSDHMNEAQPVPALISLLDEFMQHQLLFWMEVLSLKGQSSHGEAILSKVVNWLSGVDRDLTELKDLAHDARNFTTTFAANPCSLSTPHIYISVLPFTSRQSRVWQTYWPRMRGLIPVEGTALETRGKSALATWAVGKPVNSIAQTSDGKRLACGTGTVYQPNEHGEVSLWNTANGTRIMEPLKGHQRPVLSVAFSPDNTCVASGSYDRTIRIWDASNGNTIAGPLRGHSQAIRSIAFSPDGTHLASGSDDRTIRIWNACSGAQIGIPLEGHWDKVFSVTFSPCGKHIASGSNDCTIRAWDFQTRTPIWGPTGGHTKAVYSVAYSPNRLHLVSSSDDRTIRVWDMSSGTLFAGPFRGHTYGVTSVSFSHSGSQVVSGSLDLAIRVWDSANGTLLAGPFRGHTDSVNSALFSADGTRIISASDDCTIRVWDLRRGKAAATETLGHTGAVSSVAVSPDGIHVASGSTDSTVCVWNMHTGVLVAGPCNDYTGRVNSVAFSPDGARIASGSDDQNLRVWGASTGTLLARPFKGHTDSVNSVTFSPDGHRIASCSHDGTIQIRNSYTGTLVAEPFRSHATVMSIAFSHDAAHIVSGHNDRMVRMWKANDGTKLWTSYAHIYSANSVAFSSDGTRVASGSSDRTVLLFDASNGEVVHGPLTGHTKEVSSVAFSPDGSRVASGSLDQTVRVWSVQSGTLVAGPLRGHTDWVTSVAFSIDGARIISGSSDRMIRVWDLAAIAQAGGMSHNEWSISHDGWLIDSRSQRLVWVPSDLRHILEFLTPSRPAIMNARCTARFDGSTLLEDQWRGCFDESSRTASS